MNLAGVDLAWKSENNPSAIAFGSIVKGVLTVNEIEPAVYGVDNVLSMLKSAEDLIGVAIDAPLIINNVSGQRPCEKQVGQTYGSRYAACHTSNKSLYPDAASLNLSNQMANVGFEHLHGSQWQIECYPHPAIIEIFALKERLKYKRGKVAEKREGQKALALLLYELSNSSMLKMVISGSSLKYLDLDYIDSLVGQKLKSNEDALDAMVCLYIAGLYALDYPGQVFGDLDSGYIFVPSEACIAPHAINLEQLDGVLEFDKDANKLGPAKEGVNVETTYQRLRDVHSIVNQRGTITDDLDNLIAENYEELEEKGFLFVWSHLYDVPYQNVILFLGSILGIEDETSDMLVGNISTFEFLGFYTEFFEEFSKELEDTEFGYSEEEMQLLRVLMACIRIINANYLSQIRYGKSMQRLLLDVVVSGDEESYFAAVQVDKSVLASSLSRKVISDAILESNGRFFDKLSRAIKGSYGTKTLGIKDSDLREMFVAEQDLLEEGDIKKMTDRQAYDFYINDRQLYSDDLEDSFGSFIQARNRFRKKYKKVKDKKKQNSVL